MTDSNTMRTSSGSDLLPGAILSDPCMSGYRAISPFDRSGQDLRYAPTHRTNTGPGIGRTATRVSDRNRYRRLTGRITLSLRREYVHQPVEGRGRQESTMRAVTVYRLEDVSNFSYHTRHPIGSVLEQRIYERVNNYKDLLRLARRTFALDTADAEHVLIDVGQGRQAYLPGLTRNRSAG